MKRRKRDWAWAVRTSEGYAMMGWLPKKTVREYWGHLGPLVKVRIVEVTPTRKPRARGAAEEGR